MKIDFAGLCQKERVFLYHFTDVKPLTKFVHNGSSFRDIAPSFQIIKKKRLILKETKSCHFIREASTLLKSWDYQPHVYKKR
jgi:hypothetical protein